MPIPHRSEYLLVAIDAEDYLTLMDISGNTRSDIKLKRQENKQQQKYNDLIIEGYKKKKDVMILIVSIMGHEKIAYCKLLDSQSNPKSSIY